jgi:hypothetical protein
LIAAFQIGGFVPFAGMSLIEIEAELNDIDGKYAIVDHPIAFFFDPFSC